ncbi:MAG: hypothetical protein HYZ36_02695, partial [Pedosphaera parvula]|nr:hypothetical protein [Pedosphaera parvula]
MPRVATKGAKPKGAAKKIPAADAGSETITVPEGTATDAAELNAAIAPSDTDVVVVAPESVPSAGEPETPAAAKKAKPPKKKAAPAPGPETPTEAVQPELPTQVVEIPEVEQAVEKQQAGKAGAETTAAA